MTRWAWLMTQPWSIGTFGLSYRPTPGRRSGASTRPGLAAQLLDCAGFPNAHRSGIRHDGAFNLKQAIGASGIST